MALGLILVGFNEQKTESMEDKMLRVRKGKKKLTPEPVVEPVVEPEPEPLNDTDDGSQESK